MANIFDKFLNSMRLYDDDELDEDSEYTEETEAEEELPARPARRPQPVYEESETPVRPVKTSAARRNNVTAMRQSSRGGNTMMEVSMVRPTAFEDARDICDMLLTGRAVVINMEGVQVELAQRIIDFASGACYAIDGNLQKISSYIFIVTPNNIELSGDFQNMINSVTNNNLRFDD
ncbi:MAG: cell division protein SepF [Lachnospiraceae bacterium]|nr:cell division protein SepF [Lachnospiraceae bacterium]